MIKDLNNKVIAEIESASEYPMALDFKSIRDIDQG
jgi:hypothetical protein